KKRGQIRVLRANSLRIRRGNSLRHYRELNRAIREISALIREFRSRPHFWHSPLPIKSNRPDRSANVAEKVKIDAICSRHPIPSLGSRPGSVHVQGAPGMRTSLAGSNRPPGNQPRATGRKLNTAAAGEDARLW